MFIFVGNKDFCTVSSLETLYNKSKVNLSLVVPGSYFVSLFVTEVGAGGTLETLYTIKVKSTQDFGLVPPRRLFNCPNKEHYVMKLLCNSRKKKKCFILLLICFFCKIWRSILIYDIEFSIDIIVGHTAATVLNCDLQ